MSDTIFEQALQLLENVTPLKYDCGALCQKACCKPDPDAGGDVWLFPKENFHEFTWADKHTTRMPATGERAVAICCNGMCERDMRPFCCRIFPLAPYYSNEKREWSVRMDRRAWMVCPLCKYGLRGLSPEFVSAAKAAVRKLSQDSECENFLHALAKEEAAYRKLSMEFRRE